jgi:hypothetical protein
LKKVLIISPYFPPSNAADMQRIRMSLPYFKNFGWEAEVVSVANEHSDISKDELLLLSVPENIRIHTVGAFSKKYTSKVGLGSIALRSLWFYKQKVNQLLTANHYDLIYFSTTQFPVCILGAYWKKKFGIPYIIDMQDPWHSTYYQDKTKNERPAKYWFSYRLNKYLEPIAMKNVSGIISVSEAYIKTLQERYQNINSIPSSTITFGAFKKDFDIAKENLSVIPSVITPIKNSLNIVYVGRGGYDMQAAVILLFKAFKKGLEKSPEIFQCIKIHFLGTCYAPAGKGKKSIKPLADEMGIGDYIAEETDRIPFYQTLNTLKSANILFIPGSDDPQYTASKIYPYILAQKPLISLFHSESSAAKIIAECQIGLPLTFDMTEELITDYIIKYIISIVEGKGTLLPKTLSASFEKYSAENMTKLQVDLFEEVLATT